MNNKKRSKIFLLPIFFLLGSFFVSAQFVISANNKGWVLINSSNGGITKDVVSIYLHVNSIPNLKYKNWSLVGKITSSISNSDNLIFPVEKIKLQYDNVSYSGYYSKLNPTINQLGIILNDVQMSHSDSYLIKNSPFQIELPAGTYGNMLLGYSIKVEGGNYLNKYKSWNNYLIFFEMSILDEFGKLIHKKGFPIEMRISPDGNYEQIPTLSIELNADAKNANLSFNKMKDYIGGVTAEYTNALIVNADTDYQIQVASMSDKLQSINGALDVNSVAVRLRDSNTNTLSNSVQLSTLPQTLTSGLKSHNPKKYSIIYSTKPSDAKILNSKPGSYTTTLLYTISPL